MARKSLDPDDGSKPGYFWDMVYEYRSLLNVTQSDFLKFIFSYILGHYRRSTQKICRVKSLIAILCPLLILCSREDVRKAPAEDLRQEDLFQSRSILPVDLDPEVPAQRLRPRLSPQEILQKHGAVFHIAP